MRTGRDTRCDWVRRTGGPEGGGGRNGLCGGGGGTHLCAELEVRVVVDGEREVEDAGKDGGRGCFVRTVAGRPGRSQDVG